MFIGKRQKAAFVVSPQPLPLLFLHICPFTFSTLEYAGLQLQNNKSKEEIFIRSLFRPPAAVVQLLRLRRAWKF